MNIDIKKVKIIVTVPVENVKEVRNAICNEGAGIIGKVTIEKRNEIYIDDIFVRPDIDEGAVELRLGVMNYNPDFPEEFEFNLLICPKNFKDGDNVEFNAEMKVIGAGKNEYRYHVPMKEFKLCIINNANLLIEE